MPTAKTWRLAPHGLLKRRRPSSHSEACYPSRPAPLPAASTTPPAPKSPLPPGLLPLPPGFELSTTPR